MKRNLCCLLSLVAMISCDNSSTSTGPWVAKVNKREISAAEIEQTIAKLGKFTGKNFSDDGARKELLQNIVDKEILFQQALKEKIQEKSPYIKDQMVQEYLRQKVGAIASNPTEEEIKKVYDEKKSELEKVRASHILIKATKPGDAGSEAEAKRKADKLLAEIKSKGEKADFAEYAKKYSEDAGSKNQGGDLVFFKRQDMVPEFSDAAFKLEKVGDLTSVHTQFGYHIIKLTGDNRGFETLKPQIINYLSKTKQKERADALLAELRASAKVEVNDEALTKAVSSGRSGAQ